MLKFVVCGIAALMAMNLAAQDCAPLPENFEGFNYIYYLTDPDASGDRLVVGAMTTDAFQALLRLELPEAENQQFCGEVPLGPGLSVTAYVPTEAEHGGDFSPFVVFDPLTATGGPFPSGMQTLPGGVIAPNRRPDLFAWRIADLTAPEIRADGVVNGATFLPGIAPGSWATIYGLSLARSSRIWSGEDFSGNLLPVNLDGVEVTIGGLPALVYFISPGQLNVLVPAVPLGPTQVQVSSPYGMTTAFQANVVEYAPGWFTLDLPAPPLYPAAVHPNGDLVGPTQLYGNAAAVRQASPGHVIWFYGTGFGPTNPAVAPEQLVPAAAPIVDLDALEVTIGGSEADVAFAGITGSGLYQFNVTVPPVPPGMHLLEAKIGGAVTQPGVMLAVVGQGIISEGTGTLNGTWSYDLDGGYQPSSGQTADIGWNIISAVERELSWAYNGRIVNIGVTDFDSITLETLLGLEYDKIRINGNNDETNQLVEGDVFAVRTGENNYAKVRVEGYGQNLLLRWVTYEGTESLTP